MTDINPLLKRVARLLHLTGTDFVVRSSGVIDLVSPNRLPVIPCGRHEPGFFQLACEDCSILSQLGEQLAIAARSVRRGGYPFEATILIQPCRRCGRCNLDPLGPFCPGCQLRYMDDPSGEYLRDWWESFAQSVNEEGAPPD